MTRFSRNARVICGGIVSFSAVWLVLAGGRMDSLVVGIPTVLIATGLMAGLSNPEPLRPSIMAGAGFLVYFVRASVTAGVDIALKVCRPKLDIDPAFVDFHTKLSSNRSRVFFANAASLIPGTLSIGYDGSVLRLHVLDDNERTTSELRLLESHVAGIFREPKTPGAS